MNIVLRLSGGNHILRMNCQERSLVGPQGTCTMRRRECGSTERLTFIVGDCPMRKPWLTTAVCGMLILAWLLSGSTEQSAQETRKVMVQKWEYSVCDPEQLGD